ncbi:hypothetical protein GCM10010221_66300 [Streptomyces parvus]|nr:hypothetical protein GCM10010221_66300 [Streptomyces parvus]
MLVIFATTAVRPRPRPRTEITRHGRSFDPGPSSYGTSAHHTSPARGPRASDVEGRDGEDGREGRDGGRTDPAGRPDRPGRRDRGPRSDRPRPSTTAATSASRTTAPSATHQNVFIPRPYRRGAARPEGRTVGALPSNR